MVFHSRKSCPITSIYSTELYRCSHGLCAAFSLPPQIVLFLIYSYKSRHGHSVLFILPPLFQITFFYVTSHRALFVPQPSTELLWCHFIEVVVLPAIFTLLFYHSFTYRTFTLVPPISDLIFLLCLSFARCTFVVSGFVLISLLLYLPLGQT